MNETLSVIDEHITDLSTPRHSVAAPDSKPVTDSGSEYSSHVSHRISYINGHETDEEEDNQPTEEEVRRWSHIETAKHLRDLGVEGKHVEIFEEQEISGEVLLDMNQDFIFMKEFDFGVMGRRLKTWHKIKAFQEETKGLKQPPRGSVSSFTGPAEERPMSRTGNGPFLPRIPSLSERPAPARQQARSSGPPVPYPRFVGGGMHSNTSSPRTPQTPSYGMDSQRRPSAASIRELNHSRRHSSIDTTSRSTGMSEPSPHTYHQKQGSFDRSWTMSMGAQRQPPLPGSSFGATTDGPPSYHALRGAETPEADSAISLADRYDDLDRGYFSGPEGDSRKGRRVLKKRSAGGIHSRETSYDDEQIRFKRMSKRHSRIGSADSIREAGNHISAAAKAYHGPSKGRFRSLSTRVADKPGQPNTTVTQEKAPAVGGFSGPLIGKGDLEGSGRSSPMTFQQIKNAGPKFRRAMGFRAMTDIVGKGLDTALASASPTRDNDPTSARTGSTTPSATSKSSERHSTDGSGKAAEGGVSLPRPKPSRTKTKKDTSAYTRGLEKRPPQEQMKGCDYSGWMKKRSSNLMTTWKPRLFVLRGRRLSYYYSEKDTEERGLIDITAHRVLRADNDPIIALHATITGSTVTSTTPSNSAESPSKSPLTELEGKKDGDGPFFFKLVPPKMGSSRTVQFTKPATHYFQVDNVRQGRVWMAALMKATIARDMDVPIEMTNKQKTVSLKQAREMNQRPPALMNTEPKAKGGETPEEKPKEAEKGADGLMIQGLDADLDKDSGGNDKPAEENTAPQPLEVDTGPTSLFPENLDDPSDR